MGRHIILMAHQIGLGIPWQLSTLWIHRAKDLHLFLANGAPCGGSEGLNLPELW